ncbi:hypothetical protein Y032_0011g1412 [Ancylostoma ceylanicum]|uniref:Uncharacterized protein n=1 Tax=Ancylostoma ceylanicum TaxID=53326 RepID=A0A016VFL5_9BILA|nr:hypothetical protein Y032_0011g1412 [Ancylostoma ceylanicum]
MNTSKGLTEGVDGAWAGDGVGAGLSGVAWSDMMSVNSAAGASTRCFDDDDDARLEPMSLQQRQWAGQRQWAEHRSSGALPPTSPPPAVKRRRRDADMISLLDITGY